jgi:hypothetical protein
VSEDGPTPRRLGLRFYRTPVGGSSSFHSTMVVVHGIHKKTQKTPAADLALAQRLMKEGT